MEIFTTAESHEQKGQCQHGRVNERDLRLLAVQFQAMSSRNHGGWERNAEVPCQHRCYPARFRLLKPKRDMSLRKTLTVQKARLHNDTSKRKHTKQPLESRSVDLSSFCPVLSGPDKYFIQRSINGTSNTIALCVPSRQYDSPDIVLKSHRKPVLLEQDWRDKLMWCLAEVVTFAAIGLIESLNGPFDIVIDHE